MTGKRITPARPPVQRTDYDFASVDLPSLVALQALATGAADSVQQKRALDWIVYELSGTYEPCFRAGGMDGARQTDFALGKAFVGQQIIKFLSMDRRVLQRGKIEE